MNEAAWCYLEGFGCKKDKVSKTQLPNHRERQGITYDGISGSWLRNLLVCAARKAGTQGSDLWLDLTVGHQRRGKMEVAVHHMRLTDWLFTVCGGQVLPVG